MRSDYLFTSESVSEGHPDKVADQISDAIVDLFLSKDPEARIACETLTTTQLVVLAGEIRCKGVYENGAWAPGATEEIEAAVRATVKRIGYEQDGFHWEKFEFINRLHGQSAQIAQGRAICEIVCVQNQYNLAHREDDALIDALDSAIRASTGLDTELSTTGGTSDGRFIAQICAEVVEFGPINATIHKIDECCSVADLQPLTDIYRGTLERLLS